MVYWPIYFGKSGFTAPLEHRLKHKFLTVCPRICLYNENCEKSYPLSVIISLSMFYQGMFCLSLEVELTLNAPVATKVDCFSRLLKCLRSLYGEQCGPRSDCSPRSSLFWDHAVRFYTLFIGNVRQLFAADDFSRPFQIHFFLGALRVKTPFPIENSHLFSQFHVCFPN